MIAWILDSIRNTFTAIEQMVIHRPLIVVGIVVVVVTVAIATRERKS